jgi:hypothetical protein
MRAWLFAVAILASVLASVCASGVASAQGAPRELCYTVSEDLGGQWAGWIAGAAGNWNDASKKAGTGWSFVPCPEGRTPDITFVTTAHSPGGAQGGPECDHYVIRIKKNLDNNQEINGVHVKIAPGESGWNIYDPAGETTLDPVLVMEHELSHAMGVDNDAGPINSGNVSNAISPGNHGKPPGTPAEQRGHPVRTAGRGEQRGGVKWRHDARQGRNRGRDAGMPHARRDPASAATRSAEGESKPVSAFVRATRALAAGGRSAARARSSPNRSGRLRAPADAAALRRYL